MLTITRFDYVKYDKQSADLQQDFKEEFINLAVMVEEELPKGRAQALVLTKLEEAYMWVGKAIRDAQIARLGTSEEQPERGNE